MNLADLLQPQAASYDGGQPQVQMEVDQNVLMKCGPMPPRANYASPQAVKDAWIAWQECKAMNSQGV